MRDLEHPEDRRASLTRAFDPREARDPRSGKWIAAGHGLAGHLHGKPVEGGQADGTVVHGTYEGHGVVRAAGGRGYRVTHVRAAAPPRSSGRLPVGAGPIREGRAGGDYRAVARTAQTPTASTVHEPIGKPGGPGLWHHKTWQLPAYIQHVAHDLMENGTPESRAIGMAVGIVKNWAAGHDGKGHAVHPDVQAAAAKNIAQWEALKARTSHGARRSELRSTDMTTTTDEASRAAMATADINDLPDEEFGYIEPGGTKDSSGKTVPRSKRHFPLHDKAHIANALSRAPQSPFGDKAMPKIKARAAKAGIGDYGKASASRTANPGELVRYYPLEECRIMRASEGESSGRVVEAYAAIWDTPTKVHDHQGEYIEEIDRAAFNQVLEEIQPDRNGGYWNVTCLFNHGMTVHGTPAERFSLPAGVTRHITPEGKGLLTRTEYAATPLGEELLELVNLGALRSQSFTGGIVRSDPMLRYPGDKYLPRAGGMLQRVRRLVLGLREYGLCPFAAYTGAEVLGVRMQLLPDAEATGGWETDYPETGEQDPEADPAAGPEPVLERSTGNRLYRLRAEELLAQHGIRLDG